MTEKLKIFLASITAIFSVEFLKELMEVAPVITLTVQTLIGLSTVIYIWVKIYKTWKQKT